MAPAIARPLLRRVSFQESAQPPATKAAAPKAARGAAAPRANLPILTLDRFEQAMQIARLAAEHDLPDLSARAVREALRRARRWYRPARPRPGELCERRGAVDDGPVDQSSPRVVANLIELKRIWEKHHVPAESIYQALS